MIHLTPFALSVGNNTSTSIPQFIVLSISTFLILLLANGHCGGVGGGSGGKKAPNRETQTGQTARECADRGVLLDCSRHDITAV